MEIFQNSSDLNIPISLKLVLKVIFIQIISMILFGILFVTIDFIINNPTDSNTKYYVFNKYQSSLKPYKHFYTIVKVTLKPNGATKETYFSLLGDIIHNDSNGTSRLFISNIILGISFILGLFILANRLVVSTYILKMNILKKIFTKSPDIEYLPKIASSLIISPFTFGVLKLGLDIWIL